MKRVLMLLVLILLMSGCQTVTPSQSLINSQEEDFSSKVNTIIANSQFLLDLQSVYDNPQIVWDKIPVAHFNNSNITDGLNKLCNMTVPAKDYYMYSDDFFFIIIDVDNSKIVCYKVDTNALDKAKQTKTEQGIIHFSGIGNQITEKFYLDSNFTVFTYKNDGRHMAAALIDSEGDTVAVVVNTLSNNEETTSKNIRKSGYYRLQIEAMDSGQWYIKIKQE